LFASANRQAGGLPLFPEFLFNISAASVISGGRLLHPQPEPCHGDKGPTYHHYHILSQVSFPLVPLLNQWCTPPLRLQVSDCSTFLVMFDVFSTAVFFCVENLLIGIVYRYIFCPLLTVPVVPVFTGMTYFTVHIVYSDFYILISFQLHL